MKILPLVFIAIIATLTASNASAKFRVLDRLEASANASMVLLSDVLQFRKTVLLRSQLDPLFAGTVVAKKGAEATDREIVDFLVDENLIAEKFPVKDSDVEAEINNIQAANQFDRQALTNALKEQGFSFGDYFQLIRRSISKRNLIDQDIRTKVYISEDDVKNYFYNQYAGSTSSRTYRIKLLTVTRENYISDEATYKIARGALDAIRAGEAFEDVTKRVSDAPTAQSGGDLGFLDESDMSPVIRDQVKKLKVGGVSDLVRASGKSFLIIKLADIRSGEEKRLKELSEQIRNQLSATEYQRQIDFWLQRERQKAHIYHASAKPFAGAQKKKK